MEWAAFFIAPLAAAVQIGVGYAMVKPACAGGGAAMLTALSLVMAATAIAGALMGWSRRHLFIGVVASGLNVLVLLLVIASTIPHFLLNPCE
jgi:hypothetical protein